MRQSRNLPLSISGEVRRWRSVSSWPASPAARPGRTVLAIGLGEGIVTLLAGAWIGVAYRM